MSRLRYALIWFLDWVVDVRILHHSSPRFCLWLAEHPWWGESGSRASLDVEGGGDRG